MTVDGSDPVVTRLLAVAREAAGNAYAPYSGFQVGAAVLTEDGEVFAGCNVENASYSLTMCAERNAIFHAVAAGHPRITMVVIYVDTDEAAPSCGACRQVMSEMAPGARVYSFSARGGGFESSVADLLPNPFRLEQ